MPLMFIGESELYFTPSRLKFSTEIPTDLAPNSQVGRKLPSENVVLSTRIFQLILSLISIKTCFQQKHSQLIPVCLCS